MMANIIIWISAIYFMIGAITYFVRINKIINKAYEQESFTKYSDTILLELFKCFLLWPLIFIHKN